MQDSRTREKASTRKGGEQAWRQRTDGPEGSSGIHRHRRRDGLSPSCRACGWIPRAELVAICDADRRTLLEKRQAEWNVAHATTDPEALCRLDEVDAVVIATPNDTHRPIAVAAARAGKHVMCEKPLGLSAGEVREMYEAARDAGVVHMTAFTYRFAPSMRYLRHLVKSGALGTPRHFRSQRFLDWPETSWGWRQYKSRAGAGDLFDMTIHRIDFAIDLLGPICAGLRRGRAVRPSRPDGRRQAVPALGRRRLVVLDRRVRQRGDRRLGGNDAGQGLSPRRLRPRMGRDQRLGGLGRLPSARAQHDPAGQDRPGPGPGRRSRPSSSSRPAARATPAKGAPATVFRYDLMWEFISAIVEGRPAVPSFHDGLNAQLVADAVLESHAQRRWVETPLAQP